MNQPAILDQHGNPLPRARRPGTSAHAFVGASRGHPDLARWQPRNYSPAEAMHWDRDMLVSRIHDLSRNDGWASAGLTRMLDADIGSSLNLSAKPIASQLGIEEEAADELADQIEDAFDAWANDPRFYCDAQRRHPLGGKIAMGYRHRLADGEAFAVLHYDEDQPVSTCIEIVHPDRCKTPLGKREGDGIRSGVELGKRGSPVAYHFLKNHPGERFGFDRRSERVARETSFGRPIVVHAFDAKEAGQVRGVPLLAPVVKKLHMLGRYDEAELQVAVLNAVLSAFITSPFDHEQVANAIGGTPEETNLSQFQQLRTALYGDAPPHIADGVRINYLAPGADPDKPAYEAVGVWQPKAQNVQMRHALGSSSADNVQIAVDYDHVSYLKSVLGDEARWPRAGWRIVRLEEPGEPAFEVTHAAADGVAWWRCRLVPL